MFESRSLACIVKGRYVLIVLDLEGIKVIECNSRIILNGWFEYKDGFSLLDKMLIDTAALIMMKNVTAKTTRTL